MPSQSMTRADKASAEARLPAADAEVNDDSLLRVRLVAVGAWIVAPIVFWAGIIAAVLQVIQRLR